MPPLPTPFPIPTPGPDDPHFDLTPVWDYQTWQGMLSAFQSTVIMVNQWHFLEIALGLLALIVVWRSLTYFVGRRQESV